MRPFLHRWRWWLWGGAACLLAFSVSAVVFFFAEEPDGSEKALQVVQLGMSPEQVGEVLERAYPLDEPVGGSWYHVAFLGGDAASAYGLFRAFRDYDVVFVFDRERIVENYRIRHRGAWWGGPFAYWNRCRAALGI
jgi:hypothetical protein